MSTFNATTVVDSIFTKFSEALPLGWTWRCSPLGPRQTLMTVMHMVTTGAKRYRKALRDVFDDLHRYFGWTGPVPTPSALTQARGKLTEKQCRDLFRLLAKEARHVKSHAQLRYADFQRVVAVDGSDLPLRSTAQLKAAFGCPAGDHLAPQALMTVLWDVGGNVPVDWRIGRYDDSETGQLTNMLGSLGPGDLLLADRLYASMDMLAELHRRGIAYVMRVKTGSTSLREFAAFAASDAQDAVVTLRNGLTVRLVRSYREEAEHMVFVSSLRQEDGHNAQAIADLYQRRWAIETAYREGKDWLGLDELPGNNKQQIRHEAAALMIFWLMQGELEGQAREVYAKEIRQQPEVDEDWTPAEGIAEIPVRFNRSLSATSTGLLLAAAVGSMEDAIRSWKTSIDYLWRNRSRKRPGRTYRRTSQRRHVIRKRDEESVALARGGRKKGQS